MKPAPQLTCIVAAHLEQDIDLGSGLIQGLLHRDGHSVYQLGKLKLLLLPHNDVLEFITQGKQPEQLNVTHGGLEVLVVGGYGVVSHIVVAGNATKISNLHTSYRAVIEHLYLSGQASCFVYSQAS